VNPPKFYSDVNGNPTVAESEGVRYAFPEDASKDEIVKYLKQYHDGNCLKDYPPAREWAEILAFLIFPVLTYALWKVIAWIGRGFRKDPLSQVGG